jgi:tetratricopeptide (TPR) repeat protein
MEAALTAASGGDGDRAARLLRVVEGRLGREETLPFEVVNVVVDLFGGNGASAERAVRQLSERFDSVKVERWVSRIGYRLMRGDMGERALELFEFNTHIFPESWNTWDGLSQAHMGLGNTEEALRAYHRSLELNPANARARERIRRAAITAAVDGDSARAARLLKAVGREETLLVGVASVVIDLFGGKGTSAERAVLLLSKRFTPAKVEREINTTGYTLMRGGKAERALELFEFNTRIFPESWNAWDSLGEAHFNLGHKEEAIRAYQKSLELNPDNEAAEKMIARIKGGKK